MSLSLSLPDLRPARRRLAAATRAVCLALAAMALGACGMSIGNLFDKDPAPAAQQPALPQLAPSGGPKVALLLPLSATDETGRIAQAIKEAGELAMFDAGTPGITLITKDDGGTPATATAAAEAALGEGAELILGPLLSTSVQAVTTVAKTKNVPVIAFSTTSSVARPGVYLLSFLPEEEVANVLRYTTTSGRKSIAALVPKSSYGVSVERVLAAEAGRSGGRIALVERFTRTPTTLGEPANKIAAATQDASKGIQALLIAEGGDTLRVLGTTLTGAGFDPGQVKVLGTGLLDDPASASAPIAAGAWYAGVDPALVARFDQRYQQTYARKPPRIASLGYDAVSLAIALARGAEGQRFSAQQITNPEGYQGMNGLFRFRSNGLVERGLSILEASPAGPRVIAPAPTRFMAPAS